MGDVFKNIDSSNIVSRSVVANSFHQIAQRYDEETTQALRQIADAVALSGSIQASENFEALKEELQKPTPSKPIIRSLWDGLLKALPDIAVLGEAVAKVGALFS